MNFYPQQKETSNKILKAFSNLCWCILCAKMQSGKTGTYLRTALEGYTLKLWGTIYIITGVSDTSLFDQLKGDVETAIKCYALELYPNDGGKLLKFMGDMKIAIHVIKASDLKKISVINDALIIHDESHYAQSKGNRPFKDLYTKLGLNGLLKTPENIQILKDRKIKILSVSATPFSELHQNNMERLDEYRANIGVVEQKNVIYIISSPLYKGVDQLKKIYVPFTDIGTNEHIESTLKKYLGMIGYIICRTSNFKGEDQLRQMCMTIGYDYKKISGTDENRGMGVYSFIIDRPSKLTFIHLCGKGRLGQVIGPGKDGKKYILAIYESTKKPNTDTILQALLGRMCGYHNNNAIDAYMSESAKDGIEKYNKMWECIDNQNMEDAQEESKYIDRAMNVKKNRTQTGHTSQDGNAVKDADGKWWKKNIPIKPNDTLKYVNDVGTRTNNLDNYLTDHRCNVGDYILEFIRKPENSAKNSGRNLSSYPNICQNNSEGKINSTDPYCAQFTNCVAEKHTNEVVPIILVYEGTQIKYIFSYTKCDEDQNNYYNTEIPFPKVHTKCIYNIHNVVNEDGTIEEQNGGQIISFPSKTSEDPKLFENELIKAVNRTIPSSKQYIEECSCSIRSNFDTRTKLWKGIAFRKDKIDKLKIMEILNKLEKRAKIKFITTPFKGRHPKYLHDNNMFRYKSIQWKITSDSRYIKIFKIKK
jgi:hypothetical protein